MEQPPEAESAPYRVTVVGDGISVDRLVPQDVALSVIATVMGRSKLGSPQGLAAENAPAFTPDMAVGEFLVDSRARRNPEKVAAIGAFLAQTGQRIFTRDDIKNQFPIAGEKVPGNFARDFSWALASKWIAGDPGGGFYMTKTGLDAVAQQFPAEIRKATRQKPSPRRRGRKKKGGSEE